MRIFRSKPNGTLVGAYLLAALTGNVAEIDKFAEQMEKTLINRPQELRETLARVFDALVRRYFSPNMPVVHIAKFVDFVLDSMEADNRFYLLEGEAVIRHALGEDDVSVDRIDWTSMNVIRITISFRIARELGLKRDDLTELVDLAERAVESGGMQLTPRPLDN